MQASLASQQWFLDTDEIFLEVPHHFSSHAREGTDIQPVLIDGFWSADFFLGPLMMYGGFRRLCGTRISGWGV